MTPRVLKLVSAWVWSAAMMQGGLWLWQGPPAFLALIAAVLRSDPQAALSVAQALAVCANAGALFNFLLFVVDDLCPEAPLTLRAFLKLFTGAMTWLSLGTATYLAATRGRW